MKRWILGIIACLTASAAYANNVIYLHPSLGTDRHYTSARGYYSNVDAWHRTRYELEYFPQNTTASRYSYSYPIIDYTDRQQYYNPPYVFPYALPHESSQSHYPGCSRSDILIGSQIWASCNARTLGEGSDSRSGWFFYGAKYPTYESWNGINATLEWKGRNLQGTAWVSAACAEGYRLPTRGEWETAQQYARNNHTTLARLLNLPYNGAFLAYKNAHNYVTVDSRLNVWGAYWTSTTTKSTPIVMHLGSTLAGYRTDGTDMSRMNAEYRWQHSDNGLELIPGHKMELANIRCIKK